ncbi:hypothetical protein ACQKWADRAFT_293746 [Trichoderma austrokoningii]
MAMGSGIGETVVGISCRYCSSSSFGARLRPSSSTRLFRSLSQLGRRRRFGEGDRRIWRRWNWSGPGQRIGRGTVNGSARQAGRTALQRVTNPKQGRAHG